MTDAKKPDPIRAAAEEIINCGFVTPAKEFEEQICSIIRREVERECLGALCEGCKLGLEIDPKWVLCMCCERVGNILYRIRNGGK